MGGRWRGPGGYGEVLRIAAPLILSASFWSVQAFVDRMFLTWYSSDALAAALPAGALTWTFFSFFFGIATYVNTFVAQYSGADRPHQVGPSVWQGLYICLVGGVFMLAVIPLAGPLFDLAGHDPDVRSLETVYFKILCLSVGPSCVAVTTSCFFIGRGDSRTVMWVDLTAVSINIALDYAWIFGNWGFPRWGVRGAAWATVVSNVAAMLLLMALMLRKPFREKYHTLKGWRPNREMMARLVRFGAPNGVQSLLGSMGFTLFVLLVGRLGTVELAATNVVMNLAWVAFMPFIGLDATVSTLVGRYVGRRETDLSERSVWSAFHLTAAYGALVALACLTIPEIVLMPFSTQANLQEFAPIRDMSIGLFRLMALMFVCETGALIFASGVKGAGDTRFAMWVSVSVYWAVTVVPVYVACMLYDQGIYVAWTFKALGQVVTALVFFLRFRGGKWKSMSVIEDECPVEPPSTPKGLPEGPA